MGSLLDLDQVAVIRSPPVGVLFNKRAPTWGRPLPARHPWGGLPMLTPGVVPDPALVPAASAELGRLFASVTVLAEVLRRLVAAETGAEEPARGDLRVAR